jgi:cytosolic carboxypeptidase protein 2/3
LGINDLDYQREPRWPIEMQVLPGRIKHINVIPKEPEIFYTKTGLEETPMISIDSKQKTVYYYNPLNCGYFVKSRVGGSREGCKNVRIDLGLNEKEDTLIFESRFESGNLMKAIKVGEYEYDLYLRFDLYTDKHTQWFYFQIKNAKPNKKYRFTICNFLKSDSLYNMGMKPIMYSEYDAENKKLGWRRWGTDIKYYRNNAKSEDYSGNSRTFYSLTWTCEFPNDQHDVYYFAHCYPYTYSDLQDYIKYIQEDPVKSKYCKIKVLCRSLAENLIHLLTITNQSNSSEEHKAKKGVILTARVHPGETNSSWMMHGFLDFLLGNSADAKLLRDNFVFKIVPMLNPDGVIIGNYRCSLTGRDLNRNYKTILKEAFPPVWHTREMIRRFSQEREIIVYCDLHGHSRRQNIFMYGCHNNKDERRRFKERIFPLILSKNCKDKFSYKYCRFKIQKSKDGTGRIVMWNLGILNSFTLEATFAGATLGPKAGYHFTTKDFEQIGVEFCDSILDYCDPDQTKCRILYRQIEQSIKDLVRKKLEQRGLYNFTGDLNSLNDINLNIDEIVASSSDEESSDGGADESDSSADDGLPLHLERFAKNVRQNNKKRKNKMNKASNQTKGKEVICFFVL